MDIALAKRKTTHLGKIIKFNFEKAIMENHQIWWFLAKLFISVWRNFILKKQDHNVFRN